MNPSSLQYLALVLWIFSFAEANGTLSRCAGWNDGVCVRKYFHGNHAAGVSLKPFCDIQISSLWTPDKSEYESYTDARFRMKTGVQYLFEKQVVERLFVGPFASVNYWLYIPFRRNDVEFSAVGALRVSYRCRNRISFESSIGEALHLRYRSYPKPYGVCDKGTSITVSPFDDIIGNIGILLYF